MTTVAVPVLETERLILRHYRIEDFAAYEALYRDPEIVRFIGGSKSSSDAWRALAYMAGHWQLRGYGMWALESKETGEFVGRAGPYFPLEWPEPEIGWTLMLGQTGKGYATEASLKAREWAYETLGWTTAISLIHPDNEPSIRLAERLGATYEKTVDPGFGDHLIYRHPSPETLRQGTS